MSLTPDLIIERLRLKRKLRFWQALGVIVFASSLILVSANFNRDDLSDHIGLLNIEGVIQDDPFRDEALRQLKNNPKVKALIIRVNSPGGTVVGGESLYRNLRLVGETKPIVAVMGEVAASAGYMTALSADYIIAREGTITGSIGVILQSANLTSLMEKIGIEPVIYKSSPLKASPNPFEKTSKKAEQITESMISDMYEMFLEIFYTRRNLPIDTARALANGQVYTGRQALKSGLIDENGGQIEAIKWLEDIKEVEKNLPIIEVSYGEESFFDKPNASFFKNILNNTLISNGLSLDGLISLWQPYYK